MLNEYNKQTKEQTFVECVFIICLVILAELTTPPTVVPDLCLKTRDPVGNNCQRPVFSLGVSQHIHKITNL